MSKDVELFGLHYEKGGFEALALSVNSGYIATNTSMKPDADNEFVLAAFDTGGKGYVAVGTVLSTIEGPTAITIADNIFVPDANNIKRKPYTKVIHVSWTENVRGQMITALTKDFDFGARAQGGLLSDNTRQGLYALHTGRIYNA